MEEIGFTGFSRKKSKEEHGKLSSNGAMKRTGINCSLLPWQEEYATNSGQLCLHKQRFWLSIRSRFILKIGREKQS